MNTFLEKVTRSPNAASRTAAASLIREVRSRDRRRSISGDMAVDPVRGMVRSKTGEVGRSVDIAGEAGAADDPRLYAGGARPLGMAPRARLAGGETEVEHSGGPHEQGVGAAILGLGDDHGALPAGLD